MISLAVFNDGNSCLLFWDNDFWLLCLTIDDELLADMMHRSCIGFFADFLQHGNACCTIIAKYLDLDQFVGFQADLDFLQNLLCQSVITDHYNRVQVVAQAT